MIIVCGGEATEKNHRRGHFDPAVAFDERENKTGKKNVFPR